LRASLNELYCQLGRPTLALRVFARRNGRAPHEPEPERPLSGRSGDRRHSAPTYARGFDLSQHQFGDLRGPANGSALHPRPRQAAGRSALPAAVAASAEVAGRRVQALVGRRQSAATLQGMEITYGFHQGVKSA